MRNLQIAIYARTNTNDTEYIINSNNGFSPTAVYQLIDLKIDYSIISSSITSSLVLGMNIPLNTNNAIHSGQPVQITDNGDIIFQGILLSIRYKLIPPSNSSESGYYMLGILVPSIFQFTLSPMMFDHIQAEQISKLTGVNISAIIIANVTQSINTKLFLDYMITNTDYAHYFNRTINASNLSDSIYLMASLNQDRDSIIRSSIDFYNCVFYQQENGQIIIRQLDAKIISPFQIDITNKGTTGAISNQFKINDFIDQSPTIPVLSLEYFDNACLTPSIVSNYSIIDPNLSVVAEVENLLVSYIPNPKFFPRVKELRDSGWFIGQLGQTQLNSNITNNPTTVTSLTKFQSLPDQYMINSKTMVSKNDFLSSYQQLLTAKQMANALINYSGIEATISLDDPNIPENLPLILGTILSIQNCDMKSGLIATCTRSYSIAGAYLTFNCVPLGSYTGYWIN